MKTRVTLVWVAKACRRGFTHNPRLTRSQRRRVGLQREPPKKYPVREDYRYWAVLSLSDNRDSLLYESRSNECPGSTESRQMNRVGGATRHTGFCGVVSIGANAWRKNRKTLRKRLSFPGAVDSCVE
jgi:hypothetical protein